ncbi:hypothetical protein CDAR_284421 [Caerostris darwini]|uniref:Uncharacterized protein n=1 Tax=Caerostris darwini TaxID=1538125 RepID=A0AAV4UJL3_9ARAC|nr:hypothetical protein CDAR_284421 [Caerostris darwini]
MMKRSLHHPIDFSGVGFGTHHPSSLHDDSSQTGELAGRKKECYEFASPLPFVDPVCRVARGPWFLVSNHLSVSGRTPFLSSGAMAAWDRSLGWEVQRIGNELG